MTTSWEALYKSTGQGVYGLLVLPVLFLAWLALRGRATSRSVEPGAARFVRAWAVLFALEAILDLIATGLLGWPLLPFVLLGDYRVFVLLLAVAEPTRPLPVVLLESAAWTLVVPAIAYLIHGALARLGGPQPETMLWLTYEVAFAVLAGVLSAWLVPRRFGVERAVVRRYLRMVLGLVLVYYVLWATADIVILGGDDRGWALRIIPNQLYYGVFVPFAYARFFSAHAASSTSTQAPR